MHIPHDVERYNSEVSEGLHGICVTLAERFSAALPDALCKVWHGHPVWFLAGNPVVGYSVKKAGVAVLFWSGQSFPHEGLSPVGQFKAAEVVVPDVEAISTLPFNAWLEDSQSIQWDYQNLPKRRALEQLTDF